MKQFGERVELLDILTELPDPITRRGILGRRLHRLELLGLPLILLNIGISILIK